MVLDMEISRSGNDQCPNIPTDFSSARKRKRPRKECPLEHFDVRREEDESLEAICRICCRVFRFEHDRDNVTSELKRHFEEESCLTSKNSGETSPPLTQEEASPPPTSNQDFAMRSLVKYMLLVDLPLNAFTATLEQYPFFPPELKSITLRQVKSKIKELYNMEKYALFEYFKNFRGKIALSCKLWKSCQGLDYIALTAHYIDSDWKLQKRVLGFCLLEGPTNAEVISDAIVFELRNWGIESKVISVTLDDYDWRDVVMSNLMKGMLVGDDDVFFCTSGLSQVVHSIVQDCLREIKSFVERMERICVHMNVVKYRRKDFRELCIASSLEYQEIPVPVDGRWDCTYFMLDAVIPYRTVIDQYISGQEDTYPPFSDEDWSLATAITDLLEFFYDATNHLCRNYYATSCQVILLMLSLVSQDYHSNHVFSRVYPEMKRKLRNYWEKSPVLFGLSSILDPRIKLVGLEAILKTIYQRGFADVDSSIYNDQLKEIKSTFEKLFEKYRSQRSQSKQASSSSSQPRRPGRMSSRSRFIYMTQLEVQSKTETEWYLETPILHACSSFDYDILGWWRSEKERYPVLSTMARDLLTVPASTVFSVSAFHEDEKLWDDERNMLSASMLNSSKCLGDWYKAEKRTQDGIRKDSAILGRRRKGEEEEEEE